LPRPIHSTQSSAILAPRLLQVGCIMSWSFLRLITSYNHIASIVAALAVSTRPANATPLYYAQRQRHKQRSYTIWHDTAAQHRQGTGLRNLFSYEWQRPPPLHPMHPTRARPNAETPLPIKTAILYVNKNLWTDVLCSVLCSSSYMMLMC
jgi:hypothetical protein